MLAPETENVVPPALPPIVPQTALPLATHVGVPVSVTPVGSVSEIVTPFESEGPPFPAVTTYVPVPPAVYVDCPSSFVRIRLVCGERVSLSVAVTVVDVDGFVALTVLANGSAVKSEAKSTAIVNVTALPAPAATLTPVAPKFDPPTTPLSVPQLAVPVATHVGVAASVTPLGNGSLTVTPLALEGPALVNVIV